MVGRDRFAHPLVREVLHAQLGPAERLRWHTRIGALLARRYRAGALGPAPAARHLLAAAELGGEAGPAVEFARLAAADAVRRSATRTRCGCCRPRWPWLVPTATGANCCARWARRPWRPGTRTGRAPRTPKPPSWPAGPAGAELLAAAALGVAGGQGGFEIDLRDPDRVAVLTEALKAQPEGDSTARAALLGRLSLALAFTEATPEQREALSTEAVAMARRLGDPLVLAAALAARCDAISDPDHISERRGAAAEIIKLAQAGGDRASEMLGRRLLVVALAEAAEWSAVDAEISAYARQAERLAQPRLTWYVPLWRGARALMRGDRAMADAHAA